MSSRILQFPPGFIWGAATASHQNEGNNTNNDFWQWEQAPGHVVDGSKSDLATQWWQPSYFIQDVATMTTLHLNTLRLSLEWSRIQPQENVWDDAALAHYRDMLQELIRAGIKPMVTLHHFTNPLWLAAKGGWTNPAVVNYFVRYVEKAVSTLKDLCQLWCTINEPIVYGAMSYAIGHWAPGHHNMIEVVKVTRHLAYAHAAAYHCIRKLQPQAEIGLAQHLAGIGPSNPSSMLSSWAARKRSQILNISFLDAVNQGKLRFPCSFLPKHDPQLANTNDYIGINYYGRHLVKFSLLSPGGMFAKSVDADPKIAWPKPWQDREMAPQALFDFLVQMNSYGKPIYITENGMADNDDSIRPTFLLTHLAAVHRAIQQGIPVRGFYHWTLVDNYEWVEGWTTRFGLIALNPKTQERTLRPSARMFGEIARQNAITEDVVAQYAPQAMSQIWG